MPSTNPFHPSEATATGGDHRRVPRVVYLRDDGLADTDFSLHVPQHAMKPFRTLVTHALVDRFGLSAHMLVVRPPVLPPSELHGVNTRSFVEGLIRNDQKTWEHVPLTRERLEELGVPYTHDCPLVEGIADYALGVASGSLFGARLLATGAVDVAIHWAGGMHHGRSNECSGFCYINDINVAIVELLKTFTRVLYIDLDVHHGDGVEELFAFEPRVFTWSLHKFGESFFPGTGHLSDVGFGDGRSFTLNVTLGDGIGDMEYVGVFEAVLAELRTRYQPEVVVLQCGADSLASDRLGVFNLSSIGHGRCVELVKNLGLPLLALGGGGYTTQSVAKLWAYETSILCGAPLPPGTPVHPTDQMEGRRRRRESQHTDADDSTFVVEEPKKEEEDGPEEARTTRPARKRARAEPAARDGVGASPSEPSHLLPLRPPPSTTTMPLDQWQTTAVGLGVVPLASTAEGQPLGEATAWAIARGTEALLAALFDDDERLYVPSDPLVSPTGNLSALLAKVRRLAYEGLQHVYAPERLLEVDDGEGQNRDNAPGESRDDVQQATHSVSGCPRPQTPARRPTSADDRSSSSPATVCAVESSADVSSLPVSVDPFEEEASQTTASGKAEHQPLF